MLGCRVNQEDFITVNHEMGHIQYYLQYSKQSFFFRNSNNCFSFLVHFITNSLTPSPLVTFHIAVLL